MFPTCKNSQKQIKNQKSTDKHWSFDGLIQEGIDLSDIYLAAYVKWGWLVKIGFNLVHVVIECPQRAKIGSPPLFQLRVYNQIIFFDVCTALAEISTDCLTQVKALMHFFLIVIKRCHRAYTKLLVS